jgi:uncharacterized protein (DUF362 family)
MKSKYSRREFLAKVGIGLSGLAASSIISACAQIGESDGSVNPSGTNSTPTKAPKTPQSLSTKTESRTPLTATPPLTSIGTESNQRSDKPYLVVARNGEPEEMVRQAVNALGGINRFVTKGAKVIIKPNICVAYYPPEYAATTNPYVVGALVKLCVEAGASSVKVMDFPFGGSPEEAYAISGIADQVKSAGGEMVVMSSYKFMKTEIPDGLVVKETEIYGDILKSDVLINVPIAKDHSLTRLTLGMKNLLGVVADRGSFHPNYGQRLADLNTKVRSSLTVVDAVRMLMEGGPSGGNLDNVKKMDTIIASADVVAADSYAATLFGLKPSDIVYIKTGAEMGIGRNDLENMKIEEIQVGT